MANLLIIFVTSISFILVIIFTILLIKRYKRIKKLKDTAYYNHLKLASKNHN